MTAEVLHGDCLELLPTLASGSVDMVCADPPYGTTACSWDSIIPLEPLWKELRRVIKPRGAVVMTASQPFTTTLIASNREWFKYCWVWEKTHPCDVFNAKHKPLRYHEDICIFSNGTTANKSTRRMAYNPQGLMPGNHAQKQSLRRDGGIYRTRPSHAGHYINQSSNYPRSVIRFPSEGRTVHPTQKPVALMEYLIRTYTNEGETVLDFCMGSGTTLVAALRCGRRAIGIEKDANYVEIARKRIAAAQAEHPLFSEVS